MIWRRAFWCVGCGLACLSALFAFQRPFREFPGVEYSLGEIPLPPDYQEKTEWAFARLMFPPGPLNGYHGRDCRLARRQFLWTQDFPRADRHFSLAVRRLSRIHVRSVEQIVNLDEGDAYDWPWLYAVQVGEWGLTDKQGQALREYCLRGGFFMADDFHTSPSGTSSSPASRRRSPTTRSSTSPMTTPSFTRSTTSSTRCRFPAGAPARRLQGECPILGVRNDPAASAPTGAASTTTRAASWSPSPTTPTSATPGNRPTTRATPRSSPTRHPPRRQLHRLLHDPLAALPLRSHGSATITLRYAGSPGWPAQTNLSGAPAGNGCEHRPPGRF